MSSWLTAATGNLGSTLTTLTDRVKGAIPDEYMEGLAKLTLNTDEMINERRHFGEEAKRKADAKNRLGKMLPWETGDREREILVDECRDAILELSKLEGTFWGPHEMPMLDVQLDEEVEEDRAGDGDRAGEEGGEGDDAEGHDQNHRNESKLERKTTAAASPRHQKPSPESLEKLQKLQPLPPLLEDFDLDSHVGLIQRLLKEDPQLVLMQGTLSGGGARERVFWNNYFFHCAYTRYEAGLSIDEIWSYQEETSTSLASGAGAATASLGGTDGEAAAAGALAEEETVDFDDTDAPTGSTTDPAYQEMGDGAKEVGKKTGALGEAGPDSAYSSDMTTGNDFELVDDGDVVDGGAGDPEMDELEAEIARELGGL